MRLSLRSNGVDVGRAGECGPPDTEKTEAVALQYVDDPQKREWMADELSEKWERQHRTARQSDDEGKKHP